MPSSTSSDVEALPGDGSAPAEPSQVGSAGNRATARVLLVFSELAASPGSCGVSELNRKLGMSKNMVYRALTTLVRHDLAIRDNAGRYHLGPGVFRLGTAGLPDLYLPGLCEPVMRRIRDLTGETITLAVPNARSAVNVGGVRGRGVIARRIPLGRRVPLHAGPASRAILAYFPDDAVARYLERPLEPFARAVLTGPDAVWEEVRAVRERGYATFIGDQWGGSHGVAFPVLAGGEYPHGSITVAGPTTRITPERLETFLPELRAIIDDLNRRSRLYMSDYVEE